MSSKKLKQPAMRALLFISQKSIDYRDNVTVALIPVDGIKLEKGLRGDSKYSIQYKRVICPKKTFAFLRNKTQFFFISPVKTQEIFPVC